MDAAIMLDKYADHPSLCSGDPKYGGTWAATLLSALPNPQPTLQNLKEAYPDTLGAKRHFLITEVTRMGATTVCVAAIDLQCLTTARLLRWNGSNWSSDLVGGGLRPGSIVRGRISPVQTQSGFPHQTEDTPLAADFERVRAISSAELFYCLTPRADTCVADIFSGHLREKKYVIDGVQCRSLGSSLAASAFMRLYPVALAKWRLRFADAVGKIYDFPVTDSGVAGHNAPTVGPVAASIAAAKADKAQILLRIGLARAFDGDGKFAPKRCYVQVNGIVFQG